MWLPPQRGACAVLWFLSLACANPRCGCHGSRCDAEAISPIADQFLAARFCMSSSTGAVGQQSTLSLFAF
jgi:hypothetical protein